MIVSFVFLALLFAMGAGALLFAGTIARDAGRNTRARLLHRSAVAYLVVALLFAFAPLARAADNVTALDTVAEIPGVAKFTDQRGDCPRLWRVAIAPNGAHGCWTIGEIDRAVSIRWPDGSTVEFSAIQFDIYAR